MTDLLLGVDPDYGMPKPARQALAGSAEFLDVYALKSETAGAIADVQSLEDARSRVGVTVAYKSGDADGVAYQYTVTRLVTHGVVIPGLLGKEFAGGYETAGTSDAAFRPTPESPRVAQQRVGGTVIANASGWQVTGNVGELRGAQIRDGVIYHDLSSSGNAQDSAAIGYRKDGSLKLYSARLGDTASSMVADGVVHSWSWGPALVLNGDVVDLATDPVWGPGWNIVDVSARQILGQSESGDIVLITVYGTTGASGVSLQTAATLAASEGCRVAAALDGGGSAQTVVNGVVVSPSSDAGGVREVPDFLVMYAPAPVADSDWVDLPLRPGFAANGELPRIRERNGDVQFTGMVRPASGSFDGTSLTFADVPARFMHHDTAVKAWPVIGPDVTVRKVILNPTGDMIVVGSATVTGTPYVSLHSVRYPR